MLAVVVRCCIIKHHWCSVHIYLYQLILTDAQYISTDPGWCWCYIHLILTDAQYTSTWSWLMLSTHQPDPDWRSVHINLILTDAQYINLILTDAQYTSTWSWLMLSKHQPDPECYSVINYLLWWTAWISVHTNTLLHIIKQKKPGLNTISKLFKMQGVVGCPVHSHIGPVAVYAEPPDIPQNTVPPVSVCPHCSAAAEWRTTVSCRRDG